MLVRGARIHRYRGLTDVDVPIGPVTVVIGPNGAGKSSLLEALGHTPSEEGEAGRRADGPADVTWYLGFPDRDAAATALCAALSDLTPAQIEHLAEHLVLRIRADRQTGEPIVGFAYDRFRAYVDRDAEERWGEQSRLQQLVTEVGPGSPLSVLAEVATPQRQNQAFVDLDVPSHQGEARSPDVISMFATPDDISPMLFRHLRGLAEAYFRGVDEQVDRALDALESGRLQPLGDLGLIAPILRTWVALANEIAPSFVVRRARIELELLDGPDYDVGLLRRELQQLLAEVGRSLDDVRPEIPRLLSFHADAVDAHLEALYFEADRPSGFRFSRLGTGHRRWICATLDEAARLLRASAPPEPTPASMRLAVEAERLPESQRPTPTTSIRLIDEPVDGLESRVHGEIVTWLRGRVLEQEQVVLSTHQPSLLQGRTNDPDLVVVGLQRSPGTDPTTLLFGPNLLTGFQRAMDALGISAAELLFLAKALLLVEGSDDAELLQAIYGDELARRGIFVHPVGGADHRAIVNAFAHSAYQMLAIPTWVMLDGVPDDRVAPDLRFTLGQQGSTAMRRAQEEIPELRPLPFGAPDIAFGIAPDVYAIAFEPGVFPADSRAVYELWVAGSRAADAAQRVPATKAWFEQRVVPGLPSDEHVKFAQHVLRPALERITQLGLGPRAASPWLASSMERLFAELDAVGRPAEDGLAELG